MATLVRDQMWMRAFFGEYLRDLLGYDRIYVLSGSDKLVFGLAQGRGARELRTDRAVAVE
ncbi:MAG TPA: hypothetical protein VGA65_00440 [Hyphomicrobium sp.]